MSASVPKRVLVMTSTFPRRAGDDMPSFVLRLCQAMQAEGWESLVLAPHARGLAPAEILDGVSCRRFRYAPARLERLAYGGGMLANVRAEPWLWLLLPVFLGMMGLQALWLLLSRRIRVVHAHWIVPQGLVAALLRRFLGKRLRLVMTVHGSDLQADLGGAVHRLRTWALRQADVVAVVSEGLRTQALLLGVPPERIVVAPMGVDLGVFHPPRAGASRQGALFVGRLVPGKGVEHLLAAWARLAPGPRLTIIGDGPSRTMLEAQAAALGVAVTVEFAGARSGPAVAEAMRAAAVLVMPSLQEGLGLVAVEAQACACAVVASDISGIRDVVTAGHNGLLVPPGDAVALAAAVDGLLRDPARAEVLAAAGLAQTEARFGWPAVARRYRSLYADGGGASGPTNPCS